MSEAASMAGRDASGRFQPGQSGNPAGKKPGTRNWSTRFRLMLDEGDFEAASRLIVQKMREGNLSAARFIVDHVDPKPRGRPIELDVAPGASLVERYAALTRAMLAGEVSPQEAAAMARLLEREAALRAVAPAADAPRPALRVRQPEAAAALHSPSSAGRVAASRPAPSAPWPASGLHPPVSRARPGTETAASQSA